MVAPILAGRFIEKSEKFLSYDEIAESLYDPVYKYPATDYVANIVLSSILAAFNFHNHYPIINYVTTTELSVAKHNPERIWLKNVITIKTCGYTFEIIDSKENNSLLEKVEIRISRMYYAGESSKLINEIDLLFDKNDIIIITEIVKNIYKKIYVSIKHKLSKDKDKTLIGLDAMQDYASTMKIIKETLSGPSAKQDNESVTPKLVDTNTDNKGESLPVNNTEHY